MPNRNRRSDISFEVQTIAKPDRVVTMTVSLTNNSPNDYWISETLMLLGPTPVILVVVGPSQIHCYDLGYSNHAKSELVLLSFSHGEKLSSTVILSELCGFKYAIPGVYTVKFNSYFDLYNESGVNNNDEYSWLIGNSSFVIGETKDVTVVESLGHGSNDL